MDTVMEHQDLSSSSKCVKLKVVNDHLDMLDEHREYLNMTVTCDTVNVKCIIEFKEKDTSKLLLTVTLSESESCYQCGSNVVMLRIPQGSAVVMLETHNDTSMLLHQIQSTFDPSSKKGIKKQSVFNLRTDDSSASQYFQFYGFLSQQQNMMQDYVRTSTYQSAMLQNTVDFNDKVVMDVGAGSGILSVFAVQAGAKKVYAVEASSMAVYCQKLVKANKLSSKIVVIAGKVEEIDLPEKVDVIISEPMGYMLFNERMLESYVHARKWLTPVGKMFPSQGVLYCAPFTDEILYMELWNKISFWYQHHFHGMDLSSIKEDAIEEYFKQPVVDTFDVRILMSTPAGHTVDFRVISESSLHVITIPVTFKLWTTGNIHGLAFWFDVSFIGSQQTVWLSTAPFHPITHWYQVRCVFKNPLFASAGQELTGHIYMRANERQSYDIEMEIKVTGTSQMARCQYDLKNPYFRYTGTVPIPAGTHHANPTETYWSNLQNSQGQTNSSIYSSNQPQVQQPPQQTPIVNGSIVPPSHSYIQSYQPNNGYSNSCNSNKQQSGQTWYPIDASYSSQVYTQKSSCGNSRQNFSLPTSKN